MKTLILTLLVAVHGLSYADDKPEIGRYQLFYGIDQSYGEHGVVSDRKEVWKIDTATGQVWRFNFEGGGFIKIPTYNAE